MKKIYLIAASVLALALNTEAQTLSRLINKAHYDYAGGSLVQSDSFFYQYSGGRGSDLITEELKYDTSVYFLLGQPKERNIQVFYYPSQLLEEKVVQYLQGGGQWQNSSRERWYYNTTAETDSIVLNVWQPFANVWIPSRKRTYTYNSAQQLTTYAEQIWDNTGYADDKRIRYDYQNNNLVKVTEEFWSTFRNAWVGDVQHTYNYVSGTRLVSDSLQVYDSTNNMWVHEFRTTYAYDASSRINLMHELDWDPATLDFASRYRHAYTYNTSNQILNDSVSVWNTDSVAYINSRLYTNEYDANDNRVRETERYIQADTFVNYRKKEWSYNGFDQPTLYRAYEWSEADTIWNTLPGNDVVMRYYYQSYDPATVQATKDKAGFALYPCPATQWITLELGSSSLPAVDIYSTNGALVKKWTAVATTGGKVTLPVSDLPEGLYIIKIRAVDKEMTQRLLIAR